MPPPRNTNDSKHWRDRADTLLSQLLQATAELMAAKEGTVGSMANYAALRSQFWWKRLVGCFELPVKCDGHALEVVCIVLLTTIFR
jgi:hypothetical protein